MPHADKVWRMEGIVASPTPIVGMSLASIKLTSTGLPRVKGNCDDKKAAEIQPAVPPPIIVILNADIGLSPLGLHNVIIAQLIKYYYKIANKNGQGYT